MWMTAAFAVPTIIGLLVAVPFWFTRTGAIVGNVIAAAVIFAAVLALIGREFIAIDRVRQQCAEAELGCRDMVSTADAFTRYAAYGLIGLLDTALIFTCHSRFEHKRSRSRYAKEWR